MQTHCFRLTDAQIPKKEKNQNSNISRRVHDPSYNTSNITHVALSIQSNNKYNN